MTRCLCSELPSLAAMFSLELPSPAVVCVSVSGVSVSVKRPVLPLCAVDGHSGNPLYYYYYYYYYVLLVTQVIVLLIGTNNHEHSALQVSEAILDIVATLRNKQPQAQLVVMVCMPSALCSQCVQRELGGVTTH